jgi:ASC-1-like (ASCH) protein
MKINKTDSWSIILWAIIATAVVLSFSSCDVMKQSTKNKGELTESENFEQTHKRKGDTVSYKIPKVTFKDTVIYTTNRQGTTLRTVYDDRGQVSNIDCFASAIEEMTKHNREFMEQWKEKDKTKTEEFDSSFILYIVGGIAFVIVVALVLAFIWLKQQSGIIKAIADKL